MTVSQTPACDCFFCTKGRPHPDETHKTWEPVSHVLLRAESLDPADSLAVEACVLCGHLRLSERG